MIRLKFQKQVNTPLSRFFLAIALFVSSLVFLKCDDGGSRASLPPCTGKPGELLIVVDTTTWNSPFGDSLQSCFSGTVPGLPEREPYFDLVRIVPRAFTDIFKTTGNILVIETKKGGKPGFLEKKEVWAKNQLYVKLVASDYAEGARIVGKNKENLRALFLESGFNRLKQSISKSASEEIASTTKRIIGASLKLPKGFNLVTTSDNGIYWRRDRKIGEHSVIQGVIAHKFPYSKTTDLDLAQMMNTRDSLTKKLVKGSKESYYMEIFRLYEPDTAVTEIRNNYVKEMKGLWKMNGEFMGGPYFSYFVIHEPSASIYVLDGFVYAPKFTKRTYIRELEAMAQLTEFQ